MNWVKLHDLRGETIFVNLDGVNFIKCREKGATGLATQQGTNPTMIAIVKESPEEIFAALCVCPFEIKKSDSECAG